MIANYHTHTWRCNHATGTEREYVERAIAAGLKVLGFSDHTPYPFGNGHRSGFRMEISQLEDYCRTVLDLKKEYAGRIDIHLGLEAEYYPHHFADLRALIQDAPIEYLLLGQHFTNDEYDGHYSGTATSDAAILNRYVRQCIEAMETGHFLYLAHPDLIYYTGSDRAYKNAMRPLARAAVQMDIPLEINVLGLRVGRNYPDGRFWEIAGEEGATAIIGSDAHSPDGVCDEEALKSARDIAHRHGLHLIETVEPGRRTP